ncbi:amino-acid N-acetyltransferase [Dermabacteraceae bacterium TAE3-ERU27]|nr:amino-acid N-acetyltransferase [Dermabacteraceae bacterium TAE3-ERU27]
MSEINVRAAVPADVEGINALLQPLAVDGILLGKELVTLYEAVQEFTVAVDETGRVVGCGALHVMWRDLAEVRTLGVAPEVRGRGVGGAILRHLLERARAFSLRRVFCLTFETEFFSRYGFTEMAEQPIDPKVFSELVRSHDDGVAEFLDLARVKPNTLGNTRMILHL